MARLILITLFVLGSGLSAWGQPAAVPKTNPMPIYMHYMPWFQTPETLGPGRWGWHWTMNNRNPNLIGPNGQRQIASRLYPLIGPYDSTDPHAIEYHLLLMKYAGVDGVLIDWFGVEGTNGDIGSLLAGSNAVVDRVGPVGLGFGVVLEDRFAAGIGDTEANVAYLREHYFNRPGYLRHGAAQHPLLPVFGPITFEQPAQWAQILAQAGEPVDLLPLWFESGDAGPSAAGEFAWIWEDPGQDNFLQRLEAFYRDRAPGLGVVGGVAYPGFEDFYIQGGVGDIIPFDDIPYNGGQTLGDTLALAQQHRGVIDFLQLATFNDFGEGTVFEPTVERGFDALVQVQRFAGVPFGEAELELVFELYTARREFLGDAEAQTTLDAVAAHLAGLRVDEARALLRTLTGPQVLGDLNGDGFVGAGDLDVLLGAWNQSVTAASSRVADLNGDGFVGAGDLDILLGQWNRGAVPTAAAAPEPGAAALLGAGGLVATGCRRGREGTTTRSARAD